MECSDEEKESDNVIIWTTDDSEYNFNVKDSRPETTITEAETKAFEEYDNHVASEVSQLLMKLENECFGGTQLAASNENISHFVCMNSNSQTKQDFSTNPLEIQGKAIPLNVFATDEEVLASDGEIEELLYVQKDNITEKETFSPLQNTKEEIIDALFDLLWIRIAGILTPCIFQLLKKGKK